MCAISPGRWRLSARWTGGVLALALASMLGWAPGARAQDVPASAQGAAIARVAFEGADAFAPTVLQAAIETSARSCSRSASSMLCVLGLGAERQHLDLETLRADVLRLIDALRSSGASQFITTEKDAVRLEAEPELKEMLLAAAPVYVARVEIEILAGGEQLQAALDACMGTTVS